MNRILNSVAESLASTWKLLSDTTNYLSRVKLSGQYEQELRQWREQLARYRSNSERVRQVREQVVSLRRSLRLQGHDLRLGSRDLKLEGFRHDDAMGEGFRRLVLCVSDVEVLYLAGDQNHIALAEALEIRLRALRRCRCEMHFLWYGWRNQVLVLSGSASETKANFERLQFYVEGHRELLLRKLARL